MKKILFFLTVGVAVLIVVPAAFSGGPKTKPVKIVNPLPLPVTGDVMVNNTEENPVSVQVVDGEIRMPYQGYTTYYFAGTGDPAVISPIEPLLDPNMLLTIEFISGTCQVGGEAKHIAPQIITNFQDVEFHHTLVPVLVNTITNEDTRSLNYVTNQKTTIFADTDYPIEPGMRFSYLGGDAPYISCLFNISGFLKNSL